MHFFVHAAPNLTRGATCGSRPCGTRRIGEIGCLMFEAPTDVSPLQVVSSNSDKGRYVNFGAFALQAESRSETDFLAQVYLIAERISSLAPPFEHMHT